MAPSLISINMSHMFDGAGMFDQPVGTWNTSAVQDMSYMFHQAAVFKQQVGAWDTSAVTSMKYMFAGARFNQPLGAWDTSAVEDMRGMFSQAGWFDQPLGTWKTSKVRDMSYMFHFAHSFNQPIGAWDTSAVRSMRRMFSGTWAFNQSIGAWDTSAVEDMSHMFKAASKFNQPIGTWNTSAVKDMREMFSGSHFNQLIGSWDVQHALGADEVQTFSGFSKAAKCSMSQSWLLPWPVVSRLSCPSCQEINVLCPGGSEFACVAGTCRPINGNFVELGRAAWAPGPSATAVGSGCREACAAWENCSGFLLLKDGSCSTLHGGLPIKRGEGHTLAFVKRDCSLFSCPAGSVPVNQSGKDDFNAATCCACLPHLVEERRGAALHCRCPPHQYGHGPDCYSCGPGSYPNRFGYGQPCLECASGRFSPGNVSECFTCRYTFHEDHCVWWPTLLWALGTLAGICTVFLMLCLVARKLAPVAERWAEHKQEQMRKQRLEQELEALASLRAQQSRVAGVSMRYLLSDDFAALAKQQTGIVDPTFNDMKDAFWLCVNPLGREIQCPRDGRPGCALVDWIPRDDAKEQTHFMSWTWRYSLSQVQSALEMYQANAPMVVARHVSFFMCFFVNNQFRIVVEGSGTGSQDLECVFRQNLVRTGQMIAILDTWVQPVYLSRVGASVAEFVTKPLAI